MTQFDITENRGKRQNEHLITMIWSSAQHCTCVDLLWLAVTSAPELSCFWSNSVYRLAVSSEGHWS